ncbi:MAG TPA: dephospho-CoA kinase [Bryobacteraceae bacterium]|nr:dephospho-CoA kinase [Bryobacteraceae bacterium]HOQ44806.1 dephospho-CoA kinase [Bryobacteraceae bacterium]HPQ14507.1 dephospho-CoA kinase [Bryobacteraceae bacterium]HPU73565.1 dephospho-CoA kinase [Bryobacteraceae bacterium]
MLRVGLTGGLASGKSFVGEALESFGCRLIKADELGHQVLLPGGEAYGEVVREFGPGILDSGGTIDRRKLAAEVFDKPERLAALNRLVHPHVVRREEELIARFAEEDPRAIVVVEAAILIETGSYRRFDKLILAVCTPEQQIERAVARGGLTREEAMARLARQMPLEEKRKYADFIIDTSGTKEETLKLVWETFKVIRSIAP